MGFSASPDGNTSLAPMIDPLPKSLSNKFNHSTAISFLHRDWTKHSWGSSLLSPGDSPRSKKYGYAAAIALLSILALWWFPNPTGTGGLLGTSEPGVDDEITEEGPIPVGTSVIRGGREVFWWEEFPKLHGFYRGRKDTLPLSEHVPRSGGDQDDCEVVKRLGEDVQREKTAFVKTAASEADDDKDDGRPQVEATVHLCAVNKAARVDLLTASTKTPYRQGRDCYATVCNQQSPGWCLFATINQGFWFIMH
ncbi:hypothetical protein AYL99_11661 [Fonsecaea erecta]|uniref:Uncharacterized protein n=1 Tax=Fonsecaea erecta TaxID=1367422 RepID=A0A178Z3R5_9EURO|nr:hypothetical protein AYL99_11661 [Fonsecaea erecta]OAP54126.1 hypothetical protein AYL99_11661 [Fonsecaea erecta]